MAQPIRIVNRRTGRLEEEPICGEWFLRLAYGTILGRCFQASIGSSSLFSRLAGWYANRRRSARTILPFIRRYGIPAGEAWSPWSSLPPSTNFSSAS